MKRILLDTNFLIDSIRFKVDLREIDKLVEGRYELLTLGSVIAELKRIARTKTKSGRNARLALRLVRLRKIKVLNYLKPTDKSLIALADVNTIVATNDMQLRKVLKKLGTKSIYLRARKHLCIG